MLFSVVARAILRLFRTVNKLLCLVPQTPVFALDFALDSFFRSWRQHFKFEYTCRYKYPFDSLKFEKMDIDLENPQIPRESVSTYAFIDVY